MSTAISFLSGKGGSGKTTLVLSISDLLNRCGIKTLVVDCDYSTNGASYFYDVFIRNTNKDSRKAPVLLKDILKDNNAINSDSDSSSISIELMHPISTNTNVDFIPSFLSQFDREALIEDIEIDNISMRRIEEFMESSKKVYDVLLFDCQAGYSKLLPLILPYMDVNLFVIEADSISASAMRTLFLKIGNYIGNSKVYEVFNKASQEEFDTYSKIVGTFFTNIGTLMFDWKIRQAFSRSQIPDLENTSRKYGADLCEICKMIVLEADDKEEIGEYLVHLQYLKAVEEKAEVDDKISTLLSQAEKERKNTLSTALILPILVTMSAFAVFIMSYALGVFSGISELLESIILGGDKVGALLLLMTIIALCFSVLLLLEKRVNKEDYKVKIRKLETLQKEKDKLVIELKEIDKY